MGLKRFGHGEGGVQAVMVTLTLKGEGKDGKGWRGKGEVCKRVWGVGGLPPTSNPPGFSGMDVIIEELTPTHAPKSSPPRLPSHNSHTANHCFNQKIGGGWG